MVAAGSLLEERKISTNRKRTRKSPWFYEEIKIKCQEKRNLTWNKNLKERRKV